jgi:glycosyltransferase involved in cell wall biosynthesis
MTPFISIVIPLFNKALSIEKTIDCALNQTFTDFEIIIVNDGSTDDSLSIAEGIKDSRIKIYSIKNQGVSVARNFGIAKAQAEYIAFLDADDFWLPNHLENLNTLLQKFPNCGLYCTAYAKQYKSIKTPGVFKNIPIKNNWMGIVDNYFESSLKNSLAWTSATLVPKSILEALNGFDESITLGAGEDTDLWIRIALQHPVAFCNSATAIHNLESENRISNSKTDSRQFIDLDVYEPMTKSNPSLKTYLDVNRFAIGMQYKLSGDSKIAELYFNKIDYDSLNKKQRFLMSQRVSTIGFIKRFQIMLRKVRINLTPFH